MVLALSLAGCTTPPAEPSAQIVGGWPFRDLSVRADPTAQIEWSLDGTPAGSGPRVPAHEVRPGQEWSVTVTIGGEAATDRIEISDPPGGNVLILLFDDIGIDHVGSYGINPAAPPTPTLDALAAEGIRFTQAYTSPVCSPTRGILITGRHARRTGLGWIADTGTRDFALPLASTTVAEALDDAWPAPWPTSAVGKWHMAGPKAEGVLTHPLDQGFDWFSGSVGNPSYREGRGYHDWDKNTNGVVETSTTYMTTDSIDDAIARTQEMAEPWFLYLALNAAHTPLSPPPPELITTPVSVDDDDNVLFDATVEAMDTEIGRLLEAMGPELLSRTTLIAVGDNGTPEHAVDPPLDPSRAKHTVYEGGVRVPLIITGPHVAEPGSVSDALVHIADLFPTTLHIAGVPLSGPDDALALDLGEPIALDGRSLLPLLLDPRAPGHDELFVEAFFPNGGPPPLEGGINRRALRDEHFKLVRNGSDEQLFELPGPDSLEDGTELHPPFDAIAGDAHARLRAGLDRIEDTILFEGF